MHYYETVKKLILNNSIIVAVSLNNTGLIIAASTLVQLFVKCHVLGVTLRQTDKQTICIVHFLYSLFRLMDTTITSSKAHLNLLDYYK